MKSDATGDRIGLPWVMALVLLGCATTSGGGDALTQALVPALADPVPQLGARFGRLCTARRRL